MKPDIVFFGEGLPDVFHHTLEQDKLSVSTYVDMHTLCSSVQYLGIRFEAYGSITSRFGNVTLVIVCFIFLFFIN